jgi:hypothetical protein
VGRSAAEVPVSVPECPRAGQFLRIAMRIDRALVTTALSAGALAAGVIIAPSAGASTDDDHPASGATTVVLDAELLPVLVEQLEVAPVEPAELSAPGGLAQVSFPITEVDSKEIEHRGGLQFTPVGGGSLRITEFEVDLRSGVLSADETTLNGKELGEVDIFELGEARPIDGEVPSCEGTQAGLTLTSDAAAALGAPSFAGAFVGDACVVPER